MERHQPEDSSQHVPSKAATQGMSHASPTATVTDGRATNNGHESANTAPTGTFSAFRYLNFRYLWVGTFFTSAAAWLQMTTIGWVVYDLTGSGSTVGAINGIRVLPTLLLMPVVGLAADRISRQRIVSVSQFALFCLTFLLGLGLLFHVVQVWHMFLFVILAAMANTFNMPARGAMVYDVVPRPVVPNAVGLNSLAGGVSRAIGPMAAGILIVISGAATNFLIQGFLYLCIMITVLMLRLPPQTQNTVARGSWVTDMVEGYAYVVKSPPARMLVIISVISPVFLIPIHQALMPIFAKEVFHSNASALGIIFSANGVGAIFGGLITASLNRVDRRGLLQIVVLIIFAASETIFVVLAVVTRNILLSSSLLVVSGVAEGVYMATNQTVIQLVAPDHLRGRITSVLQLGMILSPLCIFLSGLGSDIFGPVQMGLFQGLAAFGCGAAILAFSPTMRNLRLSRLGDRAGQDEPLATPRRG